MDIVWPSELYSTYQFDLDNPDVSNITSCLYDDGTTIYDIFNGGTVGTFDDANQIGSTAPDGERISATWSTGKPADIDDNPFSLLLTSVEYIDDNMTTESFDINGGVNHYSTITNFINDQLNQTLHIADGVLKADITESINFGYNKYGNIIIRGEVVPNGANWNDLTKLICPESTNNALAIIDGLDGTVSGNSVEICHLGIQGPTTSNRLIYARGKDSAKIHIHNNDFRAPESNLVSFLCYLRNDSTDKTALIFENNIVASKAASTVNAIYNYANESTVLNNIVYCDGSVGITAPSYAVNNLVAGAAVNINSSVTGDFNIVSDGSTGGNATQNQPVTTYFTDISDPSVFNCDISINETGQAALTGQGWNGSDIASFAYVLEEQATIVLEPVHTQQTDTSSVVSITSTAAIEVVHTQQTDTSTASALLVNTHLEVINTQQIDTSQTYDLSVFSALSAVYSQQTDISASVSLSQSIHVDAVYTEQFDTSSVAYVTDTELQATFELGGGYVTIMLTTPVQTAIKTTPIYTILES